METQTHTHTRKLSDKHHTNNGHPAECLPYSSRGIVVVVHVSVCIHVNPSWAILGGWHSRKNKTKQTPRISQETNSPYKPPHPL